MMIFLYDGVTERWFSVEEVKNYLEKYLPTVLVKVRGDMLLEGLSRLESGTTRDEMTASLAEMLSVIRVTDPRNILRRKHPFLVERDYEKRIISGFAKPSSGVLYDGNELQRLAYLLLPRAERALEYIHIWFTQRLFATWDENDNRYHLRVSIYGLPSIISTAGMVAAPARERIYYLARSLGCTGDRELEREEDYLHHHDPRTTEIAKGYAMQAVFYVLTGEPFCDEPRCRLFNAHWQKEMLKAQLSRPDFCERHEKMLVTCLQPCH